MAVTTANEPWKALHDLLQSVTALNTAMVGGIKQHEAADFSGFPCLSWRRIGDGQGDTNIESHLDHSALLQFDLWVADDQTAEDCKALIDDFNDYPLSGVMDTTHWKIVVLKREGNWRSIPTGRQDKTGNPVVQWTSDWRFKFRRKQNVA